LVTEPPVHAFPVVVHCGAGGVGVGGVGAGGVGVGGVGVGGDGEGMPSASVVTPNNNNNINID
jgi:hypothetical protein